MNQARTVTSIFGAFSSGPSLTRARMAAAMTSRSAQETAATTRPDASSAPSVSPPCVYAPHGAPKDERHLKRRDAQHHGGSGAGRENRQHDARL